MHDLIHSRLERLTQISAVTTAFVIPLSPTLAWIFFPITVLLSLFSQSAKEKVTLLFRHPVAITLILFFSLYLIGALYSIAPPSDIEWQLNKTSLLLYAAVLIPALNNPIWKKRMIDGFIITMIITLILSYGKYYLHWTIPGSRYEDANVFRDHITQNALMAFVTFLFFNRAIQQKKYYFRILYGLLGFIATYNVFFMNIGRSGYVVFIVLLPVFFLFHWGLKKGSFYTILLLVMTLTITYFTSHDFHEGIQNTLSNVRDYKMGEQHTSVGIRLKTLENALTLIQQKPFFGYGTGAFKTAYAQLPAQDTKDTDIIKLSYNAYLNVMVELGIPGLILFCMIFITSARYSVKIQDPEQRFFAQALVASYIVGCCINPWLTDVTPLQFFALFLAVLF